jgi:hypothetical protein
MQVNSGETVVVIVEAFILPVGLLLLLLDVFILTVIVISRRLLLSTVRSVGGNRALETNIKNILLALKRKNSMYVLQGTTLLLFKIKNQRKFEPNISVS